MVNWFLRLFIVSMAIGVGCTERAAQDADVSRARGSQKPSDHERKIEGFIVSAPDGLNYTVISAWSPITALSYGATTLSYVISDSGREIGWLSDLLNLYYGDDEGKEPPLADQDYLVEMCATSPGLIADPFGAIFPGQQLFVPNSNMFLGETVACFARLLSSFYGEHYVFLSGEGGEAPPEYVTSEPADNPTVVAASWLKSDQAFVSFVPAAGFDGARYGVAWTVGDTPPDTCGSGYSRVLAAGVKQIPFPVPAGTGQIAGRVCALNATHGVASTGTTFALAAYAESTSSSSSSTSSSGGLGDCGTGAVRLPVALDASQTCFYLVGAGQSCIEGCANRGGANDATITTIGHSGSEEDQDENANPCEVALQLLTQVNESVNVFSSPQLDMGCYRDESLLGATFRYEGAGRTRLDASGTTLQRICGCNE